MRDASLETRRNEPCVADPLSMTAEEFLAGAHAAARHGELRITGGEFIVFPHDAVRRLGYTQNDTKAGGWAT
jgi:hypothetical protein